MHACVNHLLIENLICNLTVYRIWTCLKQNLWSLIYQWWVELLFFSSLNFYFTYGWYWYNQFKLTISFNPLTSVQYLLVDLYKLWTSHLMVVQYMYCYNCTITTNCFLLESCVLMVPNSGSWQEKNLKSMSHTCTCLKNLLL